MMSAVRTLPVAVIGMGCRLPGGADLESFWKLVRRGDNAFATLPAERLNRELHYDSCKGIPGKSYTDLGALISYDDVGEMQRLYPALATCSEPSFLLLSKVAVAAWENAGLDSHAVSQAISGVYIGHTRNSGISGDLTYATCVAEMANYLNDVPEFTRHIGGRTKAAIGEIVAECRRGYPQRDQQGGPLLNAHQAAWNVARCLGLDGPTMAFNAACASSLQALAQGVRALQLGTIDQALVGGGTYLHSDTLRVFSQAQSVSATGSRPFDAGADGLVVGEGCVIFLLKRLDRALKDKNKIHAVIRGVGIASDGKGKSLWAPRREGQIEAVRRAYHDDLRIEELGYLEAHATSTQLGDATELDALAEAFSSRLPTKKKIPIGSVKANIGHTLETAGAAGFLKLILAIQHAEIPPTPNVRQPNPKIDWHNSPFYLPREPEAWNEPQPGKPRRGGVNSFGIGGLNVHVVVDEFLPTRPLAIRTGFSAEPLISRVPQQIAIIGRGAVLPGARTFADFPELLRSLRDPKQAVPANRWTSELYLDEQTARPHATTNSLGGYITDFEYDWRRHRVPPKQIATANPLQFMILDAVEQALAEAKYDSREFDRTRVGVIVGAMFGGDFSNQLQLGLRLPEFKGNLRKVLRRYGVADENLDQICDAYQQLFLERMPAVVDETGSFSSSSLASRITKTFNLMGGATALEAGTASSLAALECCCHQLVCGDADMMICIGGQYDMSPIRYEVMSLAGLLCHGSPSSLLDRDATGSVPGEGSAVLLLKRLSDANRDNDPILGIIAGSGAATIRQAEPLNVTACKAALRALTQAEVKPCDVNFVEYTGIGQTTADDQTLRGLGEALDDYSRRVPAAISSVSSQIGHLTGAAGLVAVIKASIELADLSVLPSAGFQQSRQALADQSRVLAAADKPIAIHPANPDGRCFAGIHAGGANDVHYHVILERGEKVVIDPNENRFVHFDATQRRKSRQRAKAENYAAKIAIETSEPATPAAWNGNGHGAVQPALLGSQQAHNGDHAQPVGPSAEELETFLVNFVVEQTGYPPEIVEMDCDLEADLGIDSIKKAQLFGELREYFDIMPDERLSLDDFSTLRHVLDFLMKQSGPSSTQNPPVVQELPPSLQRNGSQFEPHAANGHHAQPVGPSAEELETFLVNFVVEQTGYPPEIVELDCDLEADLGIDSIKKAQLFGELREYFDILPDERLSLDDFSTLRHVLDFLVKQSCAH